MRCQQCGGALDMFDSYGATKRGAFVERYECVECDAYGKIVGDAADPPGKWRVLGSAFDERPPASP